MLTARASCACCLLAMAACDPTCASYFGLQWKDSATKELTLASDQQVATLQFYAEQLDGSPAFAGFSTPLRAWLEAGAITPADSLLRQSAQRSLWPNWQAGTSDGYLNDTQSLDIAYAGPGQPAPADLIPETAGKYVLLEADIRYDPQVPILPTIPTTLYISFPSWRFDDVAYPHAYDSTGLDLTDGDGLHTQWNTVFALTDPNMFAIGDWGCGGWLTGVKHVGGHQDPDPLVLHVTPEPASVVLLGLAALAMCRRPR